MVDSRALLSEMSDDQLLVEMSIHPTPLEEKDPLALDTIKQECIKEEDNGYGEHIMNSKIKIKGEVDLDNLSDSFDKYQPALTSTINIKCERNESQDKDLEQCASEAATENHSQHSKAMYLVVATIIMYKCDVCSCVFKNKDEMDQHLLIKNYKCNQCSETFCHNSEMQTHFRTVHGIYEKTEHCNRYRINFGIKCSNSNTRSNKPYSCTLCGKSFSQSGYLHFHERIHKGNKPYKCSFCEKSFSRSGHQKIHEKIHTESKPYSCTFCTKSFSRSDHLKLHEKIHTGIKPYNCNFCGKSFSDQSNFRRHEKIHSVNV